MNKNLLMSYEQYQALGKFAVPYTYIIRRNDQYIYYIGCNHSLNIDDPQNEKIRTFFNDFVIKTKETSRVVLVEGGDWPSMPSEEEAIKRYGEMSLVCYLSDKKSIDRLCPEPSKRILNTLLLEKFPKEEFAYYRFALKVQQWQRILQGPSFEEYMQAVLVDMNEKMTELNLTISVESMSIVHKKLFDTEFDENDRSFIRTILSPVRSTYITNRIAACESKLRDEGILAEIEKYWNEGKSMFIIFGVTHAVMQEPAMRSLI